MTTMVDSSDEHPSKPETPQRNMFNCIFGGPHPEYDLSAEEVVDALEKTHEFSESLKQKIKERNKVYDCKEPKHVITRKRIHELKQSMEVREGPPGPYEIRNPLSDEVIQAKLKIIKELEEREADELAEYTAINYPPFASDDPTALLKRIGALESKMETLLQEMRVNESVRRVGEEMHRARVKESTEAFQNALMTISRGLNELNQINVKNNHSY